MKRSIPAFLLALVMVVTIAGCGSGKGKLQEFEAELNSLRSSSFYDLAIKKDQIEEIIHDEKESIFKGNNGWEYLKDGSSEYYEKPFTVAGRKMTVSAFVAIGKVLSVTYIRNNCTESEELEIYNTLVEIYGEPDESEIKEGHREGVVNIKGVDSFRWNDENGYMDVYMYYSHDLSELHFS